MRSSFSGGGLNEVQRVAGSFRDPSGFMFTAGGNLYRQVNQVYAHHYRRFMDSGLYEELIGRGWLVATEEVADPVADPSIAYRILHPDLVPFISYPYEWSFSQLKDAARLTVDVQRLAIECGMTLIDASAYNVQFLEGRPIMIDTLSFQEYTEGKPWLGYRQFCQHFLAPIALMAKTDVRLSQLLRIHIDGIPLDLASRLLPRSTWGRFALMTHIHLHAKTQNAWAATDRPAHKAKSRFEHVSLAGLTGLLDGLKKAVNKLEWKPGRSEWVDYYRATNYVDDAFDHKQKLVRQYLTSLVPKDVWDLGANTGAFSRIAADMGAKTVAFDIDPGAVETNYQQAKQNGEQNILPLLLDLTNPSPALGWNGNERESLIARGPVDCALVLAMIHHLAIANNLPFDRIAEFLANICRHLLIEFVPKDDSQVRRLLRSREDIFDEYDKEHFEQAFSRLFTIKGSEAIQGSERRLYRMEKRE